MASGRNMNVRVIYAGERDRGRKSLRQTFLLIFFPDNWWEVCEKDKVKRT